MGSAEGYDPSLFPNSVDVPGLGDGAYWTPSLNVLAIKVGPHEVTVSVFGLSDNEDVAIAVSKIAVPQIPTN